MSDEDGDGGTLYLWHGYQDVSPQSFKVFSTPVTRVSVGLQVSHCCVFEGTQRCDIVQLQLGFCLQF